MLAVIKHIGLGFVTVVSAIFGLTHSTSTPPAAADSNPTASTSVAVENKTPTPAKAAPPSPAVSTKTSTNIVVQVPQSFSTDYAAYGSLPSDFIKNPPQFVGNKVHITGIVKDFLASGDRGGSNSYVLVYADGMSIAFLIPSQTDYRSAVSELALGDKVTFYGSIGISQNFLTSNNTGSNSMVLTPVIYAARLDKCTADDCTVKLGDYTIFPFTPKQEDITPIYNIYKDPNRFDSTVTTRGTILDIIRADSGNSLVFMQDPENHQGFISFIVETSVVINNNLVQGKTMEVTGTLVKNKKERMSYYDSFNYIGNLREVPVMIVTKYKLN